MGGLFAKAVCVYAHEVTSGSIRIVRCGRNLSAGFGCLALPVPTASLLFSGGRMLFPYGIGHLRSTLTEGLSRAGGGVLPGLVFHFGV